MAPDPEKPTAADKGKGKAVDEPKSDKPAANGKKEDGKIIDCKTSKIVGDGTTRALAD